MANQVPFFIEEQLLHKRHQGTFEGATMFIDLSGFTSMTEQLMNKGKEGAEVLSTILNSIFDPLILSVYQHGGFISNFAGDAFYALFPGSDSALRACQAALSIAEFCHSHSRHKTRFGVFDLFVKIGLSSGKIDWAIIGSSQRLAYFFKGEGINNCIISEKYCKKDEIVIDTNILKQIPDVLISVERISEYHYLLQNIDITESFSEIFRIPDITKEIVLKFKPRSVAEFTGIAEFRDIVPVFISFMEDKEDKTFSELIVSILEQVEEYGGYFNSLNFGDKGNSILVLFGAPISYEDNIFRATDFINTLSGIWRDKIKAGLTFGNVYSGVIGSPVRCDFTALGDIVNLSARFMEKADWGEIWISQEVATKILSKFTMKSLGGFTFKGKSAKIPVIQLLEKRTGNPIEFTYKDQMVGRAQELALLKNWCRPAYDRECGRLILIHGEAGMGKSRLIHELTREIKDNFDIFILHTDAILRKSLTPFHSFLHQYFHIDKTKLPEEIKVIYDKKYGQLIEAIEQLPSSNQRNDALSELPRIKTIIGSLFGLFWTDSLFEKIEQKDRSEVTKLALKEFILVLSLIKPLFLVIEDLHWLDEDSHSLLSSIARKIEYYPLIIIATCRFQDDGSKSTVQLDGDGILHEIVLEQMDHALARSFLENRFNNQISDDLLDYVYSRTEGNPFFIDQFTTYLRENDCVTIRNNQLGLKKEIHDIPPTISAIIIARIDRLSYEIKETVQIASVLGQEFEFEVLNNLIKMMEILYPHTANKLDVPLHVLLDRGEHEQMWFCSSEFSYLFKHSLLRDAVYDMQLRERLRTIHNLTADVLRKIYPESRTISADIAFHYEMGESFTDAIQFYHDAGVAAFENYNLDNAVLYLSKSLKLSELHDQANKLHILELEAEIGEVLYEKAEFQNSKKYFIEAISIAEEIWRRTDLQMAGLLNKIGLVCQEIGDFDTAMDYFSHAYTIILESSEKDDQELATTFENQGYLYWLKGDFEQALKLLQESLTLRQEYGDELLPKVAENYNTMGAVYNDKGQYDRALEFYGKSLKIKEDYYEQQHPTFATAYNNIGLVLSNMGKTQRALESFEKALSILTTIYGKKHHYIARTCTNMALIYDRINDFKTSYTLYNRALAIDLEIFGTYHNDTATSYHNLGSSFMYQKKWQSAREYLEIALEIRDKILEPNHPDRANTLNNLGYLFSQMKAPEKALIYYEQCLSYYTEVLSPDHPNIAIVLGNIGIELTAKGEYDRTIELLLRSKKIFIESVGEKHAFTAKACAILGKAYSKIGEFREGINCLEQALRIEKELPEVRKDKWLIPYLAYAHAQQGNLETALDYILDNLKDNEKRDVLPEQAIHYLSIAIILARAPLKNSSSNPSHQQKLATVSQNLHVTMTTRNCFEKATEQFEKVPYFAHFHVRTLIEYGLFLIATVDRKEGLQKFYDARHLAENYSLEIEKASVINLITEHQREK